MRCMSVVLVEDGWGLQVTFRLVIWVNRVGLLVGLACVDLLIPCGCLKIENASLLAWWGDDGHY